MHGGSARQVRASAEMRLAALVDPAIGELARLMKRSRVDHVRLGAVKDVLDRAGYVAKQKIELSTSFTEDLNDGRKRLLEEDERNRGNIAGS